MHKHRAQRARTSAAAVGVLRMLRQLSLRTKRCSTQLAHILRNTADRNKDTIHRLTRTQRVLLAFLGQRALSSHGPPAARAQRTHARILDSGTQAARGE